ncbi:MAG: chitobiase/beta-hexosaminidase C-terminal domain-containing protein, partial [Bacteroidales bacterium]|nr:chitobiase/beta-hexosaminidase C-terminal domain-containing protein [Bacteroidales bacterium]
SAMGFYPVCPGSGEYVTCTPLFDKITLHLPKEDFVISKANWKPGMFWRDGTMLSGRQAYPTPSEKMAEEDIVPPAPYFGDWQPKFEDSTSVTLKTRCVTPNSDVRIYYTTDGSTPDTHSHRYLQPIWVKNDVTIRAVSYDPKYGYSPVVSQMLKHFVADKRLTYIIKPAPQYTENGAEGLVDRLYGTTNYRIGGWQGWQGDMEVVIDLLQPKTLASVGVDCLENMRSWIFFPTKVEVSISTDGSHYTRWASVENTDFAPVRERQGESVQHTFTCHGNYTTARYVRIKAINYGAMPDWHISAGEQAWLFVDEIEIGSYMPTFINSFGSQSQETTE